MRVLVAGGAGFIGSHFVRYLLRKYPAYEVVNYDKLTYAGNLDNLQEVEGEPRYSFIRGDICDREAVFEAARDCRAIVNFAAETHVDRSIVGPREFLLTDIVGTQTLLEVAEELGVERYVQVSTDEVYGSIDEGSFDEESRLDPTSPYAASKAGGDLQVLAYHRTYGVPAMITRGSNTYGPNQYPEKMIPLFVTNALEGKKLPLYGDGKNVRDWIHVLDHCSAIDAVLHRGSPGEIYNVAAGNERQNVEVVGLILKHLGLGEDAVEYVRDRPGHDRRYSISRTKIESLGWRPAVEFERGLTETIDWYRENEWWWREIKSGERFRTWQQEWYEERGGG